MYSFIFSYSLGLIGWVLICGTLLADDLVSIQTPIGPLQVHKNVASRLQTTKPQLLSFEGLNTKLKNSRVSQKILFVSTSGKVGEARILGDELKASDNVTVLTDGSNSVELVRLAETLLTRDLSVPIFSVLSPSELQWSNFEPRSDVTYIVYKEAEFSKVNPYAYYGTNDNYASKRVDENGRDLLAGFLFDIASSKAVSQVGLFDYGAKHFKLAAEILTRIKYQGLGSKSAEIVFHWMDLGLAGKVGSWGPTVLHLLGNRDRLSEFIRETLDGVRGTEFLDFDFRLYVDGRESVNEEPGQTSQDWLAGRIPVRLLSRDAQRRYTPEFKTGMERALRLFWAFFLSLEAEEEAIMRNDPRLKSQVPLVMPNHQKALDLSWEIIEADILVAEAFELIRLEKDLFSADSSVLATARLLGSEVVKDSIDSDSVFSKRLNQFGVEFAKKELNYFNRLNKKFFKLISENSETRYDILYRLRRSVFGRGQDFGGRMNSLLSSCRDLTFTMGK